MRQLHKFSSKFFFIAILIAVIFCLITSGVEAQRIIRPDITRPLTGADTVKPRVKRENQPVVIANAADTSRIPDTAQSLNDTLPNQKIDTFSLKLSKDSLDGPVNYAAEDSAVIFVLEKKIYLYGKTKTEYKDITLTAPQVVLDQQSQVLTAHNSKDSTGQVTEEAHFTQGENAFTSDTIRYNFKTQKGLTKNTITQQGEMYVHGAFVKKVSESVTYVKEGLFTTCNLDEPHFAFKSNKLKVINQKLAVSGPAHPEFEGVPVPIYLPFGFYPLSQGRHSGLLPPQFATNEQFGLGLEGLGYYKVMNDYWDVKVYGNIYSYGGWAFNINPTYRKRYRFSGAFNFGLQSTKFNFKGDPDYFKNKSYTLTWNHGADSRARPGTSFSANVNASSTTYNRYVPNNPQLNYQNLLGSSIAYSKTWAGKPYNLTVSANHSQNNQSRIVNLSLPDLGFSVSTLYPFERKDAVGTKKWYEQLGVAYNGNFRNQVSFYDSAFKVKNIIDTLQWGARHSVPITLSLPPILNGAIMVSPSISYSQVWINQKFRRKWNDVTKKLDTTITKGFFTDHQSSMGLSFNTAIFGTYQFKRSQIYAIRHVIRPSLSLNYQPDLSRKHFYTEKVDTTGYTARFSEFEGALYSGFGEGRYGGMSFQIDNNLEMKLRPKKSKKGEVDAGDSASAKEPEYRKIRLIDGYGFSTGYNFFADSMKLAPLQLYFRTNLFDKINISASATMDPYQTDARGRDIDKYAWSDGKFKLGRITTGSVSLSTSFQSKPKDEKKEQAKQTQLNDLRNDPTLLADQQRLMDYARQNPAEFVDFNIPWSISLSYSLYFREQFKSDYSGFEKIFTSSANFNGSFNLTPKWNFSLNGYYDLDTRTLQTFQMSISREMHCWQMSINVTPIGPYRFFNFTISPKSGILQDLKVNRTRSFYTGY